jgi:hypothetical protein
VSRARNIKPGFFKNDVLADCPPLARLLFAGLWCEADREGRLEDRPKRIKAECLPYDDCDVDSLLLALADHGFILRYLSGEDKYIQILAFDKHQNPHCKEAISTIPAPCSHGASTEQAGLIPDSLNLIPDSSIESAKADSHASADADPPAAEGFQPIIDAYHAALPKCLHISVLNPKRKKRLEVARKLAKQVCKQQGWPYDEAAFFDAYWAECAEDPWMRGEVPNPNNSKWKQRLDVLLAEDRFAGVMDQVIERMRASP